MILIRFNNQTQIIFPDGTEIRKELNDNQHEELSKLVDDGDEEKVKNFFYPSFKEKMEKFELLSKIDESKYLYKYGESVYAMDLPQVSMPQSLVEKILRAEFSSDSTTRYLKFWSLLLQNPDERVRNNTFLFMEKYGITLSPEGLLEVVRNANKRTNNDITHLYSKVKNWKKSPKNYNVYELDGVLSLKGEKDSKFIGNLYELYHTSTYTPAHSSNLIYQTGEVSSIPRESCDPNQLNSCSRGLHLTSPKWLQKDYFGDTTLFCLLDPRDIVAVPFDDDYGKIRACSFMIIQETGWDDNGNAIIPEKWDHKLETKYIHHIPETDYNSVDIDNYIFGNPEVEDIDKSFGGVWE